MSAPLSQEEWEELRRETLETLPGVIDEVGLPNVLLPYQGKTLAMLETAPVLFIEKSRRIGLTWGLAAHCVLTASKERAAGGMDAMYISYSQEMTREFIDACAMWARAFSSAALAVNEFLFDDSDAEGDRSIKAFRIQFASGFEIVALSSAPRSLRGKEGIVVIDEAAFVDNLKELLKAALAFLVWGGQVVVCSTHDGAENDFNAAVQDILSGRSKYAHIKIDFDDALRDGLYERICLVRGAEWTPKAEAVWRQDIIDFYGDGADEELFCIPAMGSGAWLPAPLIEARMTADAPVLRLELPGDYLHRTEVERAALMAPFMEDLEQALDALDLAPHYAFGFDFARVADLSVGALLAIESNLARREALSIELRNVPGDEQKQIVEKILARVRTRLLGAAFDATGMGWTVAEDMGRLFGFREKDDDGGLVAAIKFTTDWYRVHMPPLKAAFEDDMISVAPDEAHLSDLRLVKVIRGVPRVPDVRVGVKGKKRHGDYAVALALAHYASRLRWVEYDYRPAPSLAGGEADAFDSPLAEPRDPYRAPLGARLRGSI